MYFWAFEEMSMYFWGLLMKNMYVLFGVLEEGWVRMYV
jgi:hypothetical protein